MNPFKGCVLISDLCRKANVNNSLFIQIPNIEFRHMGGLASMVVTSLPDKYRKIAEKECIDLENYWGFTYFSRSIGMSKDYLSQANSKMNLVTKNVGGVKLIKLTDKFKELICKGMTPIKIKRKNDLIYVKEVIDMYGIKIGFY